MSAVSTWFLDVDRYLKFLFYITRIMSFLSVLVHTTCFKIVPFILLTHSIIMILYLNNNLRTCCLDYFGQKPREGKAVYFLILQRLRRVTVFI